MISAQACWGFAIVFVVKLYDLDLTKNLSVTCLEINKMMPECYPKTPYYSAQESVEKAKPEREAIDWAYTREPRLIAGTSSINFSPGQTVTRAMARTFLWKAEGMPELCK